MLLKLVGSCEIVHCAMVDVQDPIKEALPMRLSTSSRSPSPDSQVTFLPKIIKVSSIFEAYLDLFSSSIYVEILHNS